MNVGEKVYQSLPMLTESFETERAKEKERKEEKTLRGKSKSSQYFLCETPTTSCVCKVTVYIHGKKSCRAFFPCMGGA